ncbi:[Fe-Fe] hydrogenase large subunit C-terminal domain-containing protein [Clostridium sp.]|uniref:[Fe-Fe] hydrogenase large subunit C-terminal domain-containing protein n=1 Tax=Clostridium sp. TaxID=1506 RepID=UPI0028FE284B|nr:[Fe-Fe] hydrogenase large subunit C-terminal domain-containing protein [Clostridium sp.]MDU2157277.1 [Fe-Fe] hydrogenase large subunit C-terminal domain-containing protein [Clostridium sp.]
MHNKYNDLFDTLVRSYYEGNFDETLSRIMVCHEISPQETFKIITSLCGVSIDFDNNYVYNIKKAITNYAVNKRFIEKLDSCNISCKQDENKKFKCQASCPFDAILYDDDNKSTYIDYDSCVGCGLCIDSCKDGKILDKIDFIPILDLIKNNKNVIAAVAPAIMGQFGEDVSMDQLRAAFIKIGFTDMIEVAFAADMITIKEAVEFNHHVNGPNDLMITSCCCPMWVGMLKKVYKELVPDLSPSVSPMIGAGRVIKKLNPDAKVVFIGPCIAKKAEAKEPDLVGDIDFVLTFQEVDNIFKAFEIKPRELQGIPSKDYASRGGRLYARTGGVSIAVGEAVAELYPEKAKLFSSVKAEGVRECKEVLNKALNGEIKANFVEGMGCIGGCVGGPKAIIPKEQGKIAVDNFAYHSPIKVATHSTTMDNVLEKLNITSLQDFEDDTKTAIFHRDFK